MIYANLREAQMSAAHPPGEALPVRGNHAIDAAAWGIEWFTPFSHELLLEIQKAHHTSTWLAENLPNLQWIQGVEVTFAEQGATASVGPDGIVLSDQRPNRAPTWQVSLQGNTLSVSCQNYDRWLPSSARALQLLEPLISIIEASGNLAQVIGLQYQDAWVLNGKDQVAAVRSLIRADNDFLPPVNRSREGPWHVHQGWFETPVDERKVLTTLNIDILQMSNDSRRLNLLGSHRTFLQESTRVSSLNLRKHFDDMHALNKGLLHKMLTEDAAQRIGLVTS